MGKSELYRANAAECLVMASSMTERDNRVSLLDMAGSWLRLAEQAEKNRRNDMVYETPLRRCAGREPLLPLPAPAKFVSCSRRTRSSHPPRQHQQAFRLLTAKFGFCPMHERPFP